MNKMYDGNIHIIPNYGKEHYENIECWCCPEIDEKTKKQR